MDSEPDDIQVKVNGRPTLTIEQIAEQAGVSVAAAYKMVSRAGLEPVARIGNVYDPAAVRAIPRPGKGGPGIPRTAPDARARRASGVRDAIARNEAYTEQQKEELLDLIDVLDAGQISDRPTPR